MKILFLSPHKHMVSFLESFGDEVKQIMERIDKVNADFIISYGYRYKISKEIVERFRGRAINLHISYLPWNRGADPNLWSFLQNTPKGVTIHYLDENIDTGPIIAQQRINYDENDTLRTTYNKLTETIENLFKETWPDIRTGNVNSLPQLTYHRTRDKERYKGLLTQGWDTSVKDIIGKGVVGRWPR